MDELAAVLIGPVTNGLRGTESSAEGPVPFYLYYQFSQWKRSTAPVPDARTNFNNLARPRRLFAARGYYLEALVPQIN